MSANTGELLIERGDSIMITYAKSFPPFVLSVNRDVLRHYFPPNIKENKYAAMVKNFIAENVRGPLREYMEAAMSGKKNLNITAKDPLLIFTIGWHARSLLFMIAGSDSGKRIYIVGIGDIHIRAWSGRWMLCWDDASRAVYGPVEERRFKNILKYIDKPEKCGRKIVSALFVKGSVLEKEFFKYIRNYIKGRKPYEACLVVNKGRTFILSVFPNDNNETLRLWYAPKPSERKLTLIKDRNGRFLQKLTDAVRRSFRNGPETLANELSDVVAVFDEEGDDTLCSSVLIYDGKIPCAQIEKSLMKGIPIEKGVLINVACSKRTLFVEDLKTSFLTFTLKLFS